MTMKQQTITFTPESDLRKGLYTLAQGLKLVIVSLARIFNKSVYKYPYAYIVATLIASLTLSFIFIANARQERDAVNKKNYELQKKVEQLQIVKDSKSDVKYVYCQ